MTSNFAHLYLNTWTPLTARSVLVELKSAGLSAVNPDTAEVSIFDWDGTLVKTSEAELANRFGDLDSALSFHVWINGDTDLFISACRTTDKCTAVQFSLDGLEVGERQSVLTAVCRTGHALESSALAFVLDVHGHTEGPKWPAQLCDRANTIVETPCVLALRRELLACLDDSLRELVRWHGEWAVIVRAGEDELLDNEWDWGT